MCIKLFLSLFTASQCRNIIMAPLSTKLWSGLRLSAGVARLVSSHVVHLSLSESFFILLKVNSSMLS